MRIVKFSLLLVIPATLVACGNQSSSGSDNPRSGNSNNAQPQPSSPIVTPTPTVSPTMTPIPSPSVGTLSFTEEEIPNFHQVSPVIYRSGEPTDAAWAKLKSGGIKTVISLVSDSIGDADQTKERNLATAAGLQYINVPMSGLMKPTIDQINQAVGQLVAPQNQPVLVHCTHGQDRTGIVVASYHIRFDKWSVDQAKTDMYNLGHTMLLSWWDSVLTEVH